MFKRIAMLLLIAVSTAGCVTEQLDRNDCDWAQPITPSRKDVLTRQTKEQIAAHNEAGARICRWKSWPARDTKVLMPFAILA
jgi:hypothetical protein